MTQATTRLLLIDDDPNTHGLYPEFLTAAGFQVEQAHDGLEGLAKATEHTPDIILTGIMMPKMDGFTLVEALKKNIVTARVPVIFLSHLGREEDERRSRELGVKDFIVRDMTSPREVVSRLRAQLTATEYFLGIDTESYDAARFARDMGLHTSFVCASGDNQGQRYVLRLKLIDAHTKRFEAELVCL